MPDIMDRQAKNYEMRHLDSDEQNKILPLLGRCFPDYWEQIAVKTGKMPFEEISFAAFDGDIPIGHCGIIPYEMYCNGQIYKMAGIASVATAPEYRKQGIAQNLCKLATGWAAENGFASLPLYTAFFRVYEVAGWKKLDVPETLTVKLSAPALNWRHGKELTATEQQNIIHLYNSGEIFNGKVLRKDSGTLHSWARIFEDMEFEFAVISGAYAIKSGGVIIECNFDHSMSLPEKQNFFAGLSDHGAVTYLLPPTGEISKITEYYNCTGSALDAMHGERPMVLDIIQQFHIDNQIFFPVTDKF